MLEIVKDQARKLAQKTPISSERKLVSETVWKQNEFEFLSNETDVSISTLRRWFKGSTLQEATRVKILKFVERDSWDEFASQGFVHSTQHKLK